jgi:hypothetical protein
MSTEDDNDKVTGGGKPENPWGYYYLRYFVGAVVGSGLLVLVLRAAEQSGALPFDVFKYAPDRLPKDAEEYFAYAALVTALGAAGLAFCYIASAPILVLHAFRGRLSDGDKAWWAVGVFAGVVTLVLVLLVTFLGEVSPSCLRTGGYVPFSLVLLIEILAICWPELVKVRKSYVDLVVKRARRKEESAVKEYVESYQHLREHGNAFLILLLEVILAAALYAANTPTRFFGLLVIWIIPAGYVWYLGTWLEAGIDQVPRPDEESR